MHPLIWLPRTSGFWVLAASGWALAIGLVLAATAPDLVQKPEETPPHLQEATPDSEVLAPLSDPAGRRRQILQRLGVERWHKAGLRGQGIKIAILDSGFRGYKVQLGRALPARVQVRSFRSDGDLEAKNSQHGILCAEVIHALAPDAELALANWEPDRSDQFLEAVRWARRQGARILSCSLIMPSWSDGEGGGPVHEALARLLGQGDSTEDLLCLASAGNTAQRHWGGSFRDDGQGFHSWRPGQRANLLHPWGEDQVSVELCWREACDYDLMIYEGSSDREVAHSWATSGRARRCAVARFWPRLRETYRVEVRLAGGKGGEFHIVALGGGLECATATGSIPFPADGPAVLAIGAVGESGERTVYSSCGPNSTKPKPDLVAIVPFPSLWRPRPFSGTSAAAPQAAGLAALWWSRYPQWTAGQVREAMRRSARDLGPPGHDYQTGYGLVNLP